MMNTASNYQLLKKLAAIQGLEVALFPCNQVGDNLGVLRWEYGVDWFRPVASLALTYLLPFILQFGGQEPGTDADVKEVG